MELRELQQDGAAEVDVGLEEGFRALRCRAAALQHAERLSSESWDWAENIEDLAWRAAETMREEAEHPADRVGAVVAQAAWRTTRRSSRRCGRRPPCRTPAARRRQEKELRRVATEGEEHYRLVDPDMPAFLGYVASHTDSAARGRGRATSRRLRNWPRPPRWRTRPSEWRRGWPAGSGVAPRSSRPAGPARRLSWPRCTGRRPTPTRRVTRSWRSPRPCAASGPPAAPRVLALLLGLGQGQGMMTMPTKT
jgi:hypothetical protein